MQRKQLTLVIVSLLVVVLSLSLAYFTTQIIGKGKDVSVTSANLQIVFTDSDGSISGSNIEPGWSTTKTFTVENKSKETYKYNIVIKDLVNTFVTNGYLQYKITSTNNGYNMTEFKDIPKSSAPKDKVLAYSVVIPNGVTQSYTIGFKYANDESVDQSDDMGKKLSGTLYIEKGTLPTLSEKLFADNPTIQTRSSFDAVFTETNTGTLYKATESIAGSPAKDVYYFAGDAKNNWVNFGKYQTDYVVYRGYSETGSKYIDYLTMEACTSASNYNINCTEQIYWNKGNDIYWRIVRTNYDGSVKLLYAGNSPDTTSGYIGTSAFNSTNNDSMYVGYKYGTSGTLANNRLNTNDSTIKTFIDNWYSNNLTSYTKYISTEAVYCNDRKAPSYSISSSFDYYVQTRLGAGNPTYDCEDSSDAFSGSNSEAKLTHPIGLMTADEITYAGGKDTTGLTSPYAWYYLNSAGESITGTQWWWSLSPRLWNGVISYVWFVFGSSIPGALLSTADVNFENGVRPAISLKSCVKTSGGDGTADSPYTIEESTSGC